MGKYYGYFPSFVNWSQHSYLGPSARDSFSWYKTLWDGANTARNYDLRANPHLFDEAVKNLRMDLVPMSAPSDYPPIITNSFRELNTARERIYTHLKNERDAGLKDIELRKQQEAQRARERAEAERRHQEEQVRLEAQRKAEEKRLQEEYQRKIREKTEEKNYWNARFTNLEGKINTLMGKVKMQEYETKSDINFLQGNLSGVAKQNDLMSQSVTFQEELSNISQQLYNIGDKQKIQEAAVEKNKQFTKQELKDVRKNIQNLKDLYNVSEKKLKLNESAMSNVSNRVEVLNTEQGKQLKELADKMNRSDIEHKEREQKREQRIEKLETDVVHSDETHKAAIDKIKAEHEQSVLRHQKSQENYQNKIQAQINAHRMFVSHALEENAEQNEEEFSKLKKQLDDNSLVYQTEKKKILGEIQSLQKNTKNSDTKREQLSQKLKALESKHDKTKNELLGELKKQQALNQTAIDNLKADSDERYREYDRDVSQIQRELGVNRRAYADKEREDNRKFKTLFDYNAHVNRQIQQQNKHNRIKVKDEKRKFQPDLVKMAFWRMMRGRFFELVNQS